MARDKTKADPKKPGRIAQIRETYRMTRDGDPQIGWILLGWFAAGAVVGGVIGYVLPGHHLFSIIAFGILFGLLAVTFVFGRRAQRSAISQIEGRAGAAASVLGTLRRGWKVEPAIAFNKQQDLVTRVVGPPGIVLIGEGSPGRLKALLTSERRRHERVASEVTITELMVGDGDGQVSLGKLTRTVQKLPRTLKPAEMTDVLARLRAVDAMKANIPLPKGPVPTSMKGMRGNLRGR